jgi:D-glycero-alpha-D-manno-heptose-7-phosphate kinase
MGDIPSEGSGLGSSSTVTVGSLHAMYVFLNESVTAGRLAHEACQIEIDHLEKPIGIQDQYIVAYGGLRLLEFSPEGEVKNSKVELKEEQQRLFNENLLLFFTGVTRKADRILDEQKLNINNRLPILRKMKKMAYEAHQQLQAGNIEMIGELLHESWQLKKQLANQISNRSIETIYDAARKAGAIGGKITGAGGGGFLLLYCPHDKQKAVRAAMHQLQELPFQIEPDGTKVIFNYRRPK